MFLAENEDEDGAYDWPNDTLGNEISSVEESFMCPICQVRKILLCINFIVIISINHRGC